MTDRDQYDTLAPEFRLRVNGAPLPNDAAADLISVAVINDVDAMGMFTLTLSGWDAVEMKVKWMDSALFREGNPVEVEIGFRDGMQKLFSGEITGLEPDFPEAQPPTFTVRGYDRLHRMMRERKTRSYTNIKDSDIAAKLAGDAGLTPDAQDSKVTHAYVLQHNQTDLDFLLSRARRIAYEVVVNDKTLAFRERAIRQGAALTLRRDIELLEFRPRLTTMGQVQQLVVRGWSAKDKKELVGRAAAGDEPSTMQGSEAGPASVRRLFGKTGSAFDREPVQSQEEADRIARQRFCEMALGYICGDGTCIGEPRLRPGTVVSIEGLGTRFSGLYYVTRTHHCFTPRKGYRTHFAARRNAT
jgi:phage protein D